MLIRFANFPDIDAIVEMGAIATRNGAWAPISTFDVGTARKSVSQSIEEGLSFVAEHEGRVVGCILHRMMSWVFSESQKYLEAIHFHVEPAARRLRDDRLGLLTAEALLQASKDLANATDLHVYASMMWGPRIEVRDRFMRKAGFSSVGGTFVFAPNATEAMQAAE